MERISGTLIDFLQGQPINKDDTLGAVQEIFHQWSGTLGSAYHPTVGANERESSVHQRAQSGQTREPNWAPPPGAGGRRAEVDPEIARARAAARQVMGFSPSDILTEELIARRKRQLARRYHPDRQGGSVRKMAEVNNAADILVASL